jgi:orotidine-5'-phosphate decarboxylase
MNNFADRLLKKVIEKSSLVVGIDPDFSLMPKQFLPNTISRESITLALTNFCNEIIEAVADLVPSIKFQAAYFERYGSAGFEALAQSISTARKQNLEVILDCKRGDVASTSLAYADAFLKGKAQIGAVGEFNSGLDSDCITVNPFMGADSLEPFVSQAKQFNKGLFILAKTSNLGSKLIQDKCDNSGRSISEIISENIHHLGSEIVGEYGYSSIGAVVGATFPNEIKKLRKIMPRAIFLLPGVGTQGGSVETIIEATDEKNLGALISISRSLIYPLPEDLAKYNYKECVRKATLLTVQNIRLALSRKVN